MSVAGASSNRIQIRSRSTWMVAGWLHAVVSQPVAKRWNRSTRFGKNPNPWRSLWRAASKTQRHPSRPMPSVASKKIFGGFNGRD